MRWLVVILIILIALAIGAVFGYLRFGNVIPALAPAISFPSGPAPTFQANANVTPGLEKVPFSLELAPGYKIGVFAKGLGGPRDLLFSPQGTLIVSVPSSGKVVALTDTNGDGRAEATKDLITGLNKPHGLAFYEGKLYVAEETKVSRYNFDEANLTATIDRTLFNLPDGERHSTRTLEFDKEGRLFISVGSSCDVCVEPDERFGTIMVVDPGESFPRIYARGLRNAVFMEYDPTNNRVWATEMGRDFLGDNLPPDEINLIQNGKDYGWPYCYGDRVPDLKFDAGAAARCGNTEPARFDLPAHSAPLGLSLIPQSTNFPIDWHGDLLVGMHGSWNRSTPIGYKVVRLNVDGDRVTGSEDFITGWLDGIQSVGRPVDIEFDKKGNIFISDDKSGYVYIVTKS